MDVPMLLLLIVSFVDQTEEVSLASPQPWGLHWGIAP